MWPLIEKICITLDYYQKSTIIDFKNVFLSIHFQCQLQWVYLVIVCFWHILKVALRYEMIVGEIVSYLAHFLSNNVPNFSPAPKFDKNLLFSHDLLSKVLRSISTYCANIWTHFQLSQCLSLNPHSLSTSS